MHLMRRELDSSGWRARVKAMAREVRFPGFLLLAARR